MGGGTYDIKQYLDSIKRIRNKITDTDIVYETLDIQLVSAKYSNTKTPIFKIVIDNTPISRNNNLTVVYDCLNCRTCQEITLNLFTRKINKQGTACLLCKNSIEEKRNNHSTFMRQNFTDINQGNYSSTKQSKKQRSLTDYLAMSESDWLLEDGEFKDMYNNVHLTVDEFNRIRGKIINIGNGKLTDLSSWEYIPHYRVFNQTRFTPMLVNKTADVVEKPLYISFSCDNCGHIHVHRDLEIIKNKIRILCRDCTLTNKTFRLRKMELRDGSSIMWQSVPERRFIEWCQDNNISIKNGPRLQYSFLGRNHEYRVDFELPEIKLLIEIKDNHCWHQRQVESGKHSAKEESAKNWCIINNYKFKIVFPKTNATIREYILSQIL